VPALDKTCVALMSNTHSKETAKISILAQARSESNTQTELFTTSLDFQVPGTAQMLLLWLLALQLQQLFWERVWFEIIKRKN